MDMNKQSDRYIGVYFIFHLHSLVSLSEGGDINAKNMVNTLR